MIALRRNEPQSYGFTLLELLVVLAIFGTLIGVASVTMFSARNPLAEATQIVEGSLRQSRARAMASTSAYRLSATATGFIAETANTCGAATWTADERYSIELPENVVFLDSTWQVCFNGRGVADRSIDFDMRYTDPRTQDQSTATITVFLGGAIAATFN